MTGALRAVVYQDARAFRKRAFPFLMRDEARSNLMLGIVTTVVEQPDVYREPFLATVERASHVVAAVLRTPPYGAVVADVDGDVQPAAEVIAGALSERFSEVPGVLGNVPVAEVVARALERHLGGSAERKFEQGVYAADRVSADRPPAAGTPRPATLADGELVMRWIAEFTQEVGLRELTEDTLRLWQLRLRGEGGGVDLWEDAGAVVALTGFAPSTPSGARIGPVYTPPSLRGRGYARSLVVHTTQRLLASGRRFCFLYTDLANPTSNRLYREIGYRPVCVAEDWRIAQA